MEIRLFCRYLEGRRPKTYGKQAFLGVFEGLEAKALWKSGFFGGIWRAGGRKPMGNMRFQKLFGIPEDGFGYM